MLRDRLAQAPVSFDASALRAGVDALTEGAWTEHFNRAYYQGDWSALPLRSIGGATGQIYPDPAASPSSYAATPLLAASPAFEQALATFRCPQRAVRLLRLRPGARIREHTDLNLAYDYGEIRLHVPIVTNPAVEFCLAGNRIVMSEGDCWYVNFTLPHSVYNGGSAARVHLVIDCVVNDWIEALFST
jgi:quercetin dioxygenase-like cupin family protein